eukprot:m.227075 g.227075  ORF g.227075 m.227075 type:complete len:323 (+) comp15173_c0_seq7:181-1149(+)
MAHARSLHSPSRHHRLAPLAETPLLPKITIQGQSGEVEECVLSQVSSTHSLPPLQACHSSTRVAEEVSERGVISPSSSQAFAPIPLSPYGSFSPHPVLPSISTTTVPTTPAEDPIESMTTYLAESGLQRIMEGLIRDLYLHKPSNPVEFMLTSLGVELDDKELDDDHDEYTDDELVKSIETHRSTILEEPPGTEPDLTQDNAPSTGRLASTEAVGRSYCDASDAVSKPLVALSATVVDETLAEKERTSQQGASLEQNDCGTDSDTKVGFSTGSTTSMLDGKDVMDSSVPNPSTPSIPPLILSDSISHETSLEHDVLTVVADE